MVRLATGDAKSEDDIRGIQYPEPGRYLLAVTAVDESMSKYDAVILTISVLAGTTPGQRGRSLQEKFFVSEKALPRLTRMAMSLGLLRPGDDKDVSFEDARGNVFCGVVVPHSYTNDKGKEVDTVQLAYMDFWNVNNPECQDIRDVPEVAQTLSGLRAGASQPQQQQTQQAPAQAQDKWGGI